jgi:hypothetical protein
MNTPTFALIRHYRTLNRKLLSPLVQSKIRIIQQVKNNISTVQDTKQPTYDGTAQSGLFKKDESASVLLSRQTVQMEIAQTDIDLILANPCLTVFAVEETTETDIVQNKTAQPDFVQNETNQAEQPRCKLFLLK